MVEEERRAVFFHEEAADSEELCEEALRCQSPSISFSITPECFPSHSQDTIDDSNGHWKLFARMRIRTVAVLVAALFAALKERAVRRLERANIVGEQSRPGLAVSTLRMWQERVEEVKRRFSRWNA
jgi:hypothetical protein